MAESVRGIHVALKVLLSIFVFRAAVSGCAQEMVPEIPKIKVDVALVTADVTVLGSKAPELQAEDFIVYDNDIAQQVTHFSRDKLPIAVALVIDRSSSIRPYLPLLQKASIAALGRLRPEDPVALFTFDDDLLKLSDLTADRARIAAIIGKLTIGNGTNINDAIGGVAVYLRRKAPDHRRAIILVSDNCHTLNGRTTGDIARVEVLESTATLYSIKTPGDNYASNMRVRDPGCHDSILLVRQLADETGGQVLDVKAGTSLQEALENAISHLRLQYTLGFSPSDAGQAGSFHKLGVKFAAEDRCPGCRLLARSGYYVGNSPASLLSEKRAALPEPGSEPDPLMIRRKLEAAETIDLDLLDIPFLAGTSKQEDADGKPQVRIDLQIDFSGIGFKTVDGRRACKLHIAVFPADENGKALDPQFRRLEGGLREETYNRVREAGMAISISIPLKVPKQNLKIVIYDEISESVGSRKAHFP